MDSPPENGFSQDTPQGTPHPKTYSPSEAAKTLGLSKTRVLQMLKNDPPELIGNQDEQGRWRIPAPHVEGLRRQREQEQRHRPEQDHTEGRGEDGELVEALRDQIEYLQRQVEEEREARRRADVLLTRLMDRVPELEGHAPQGRQDAPRDPESTTADPSKGTTPQSNTAPENRSSRPLWRRIFGR